MCAYDISNKFKNDFSQLNKKAPRWQGSFLYGFSETILSL